MKIVDLVRPYTLLHVEVKQQGRTRLESPMRLDRDSFVVIAGDAVALYGRRLRWFGRKQLPGPPPKMDVVEVE